MVTDINPTEPKIIEVDRSGQAQVVEILVNPTNSPSTGPPGPPGAQGPSGAQGPQGPAGPGMDPVVLQSIVDTNQAQNVDIATLVATTDSLQAQIDALIAGGGPPGPGVPSGDGGSAGSSGTEVLDGGTSGSSGTGSFDGGTAGSSG